MLSGILGVRRASVTTTLAGLEQTGGLVRQRGGIDVCDHAALKRRTCECYQIIASEYGHLIAAASMSTALPRIAVAMRNCLCCI